jgi:hypothetical protein
MSRHAVLSIVLSISALGACGGGDGTTAPGSPGPKEEESSSSSYAGECCLNGQFYACSTKAAFDLCAGFDVLACHDDCDFGDFACHQSCDDKMAGATHDPSQCTRQPELDVQCGSSGPSGPSGPTGCVGTSNGMACTYSTQCPDGYHCSDGKCTMNAVGNPCTYSTQCGAGNHCTDGCCYSGATGNPCTYSTQCNSGNCTNGRCQ